MLYPSRDQTTVNIIYLTHNNINQYIINYNTILVFFTGRFIIEGFLELLKIK